VNTGSITATGDGQGRDHGRRIASTAADEIARAHHAGGMTATIFVSAPTTGGAIVHLQGKSPMTLELARVQLIV